MFLVNLMSDVSFYQMKKFITRTSIYMDYTRINKNYLNIFNKIKLEIIDIDNKISIKYEIKLT